MKKVWLVKFPTFKYNEDVKELAQKANLKIINAKFAKEIDKKYVETDAPKLTLKDEYKPKKK